MAHVSVWSTQVTCQRVLSAPQHECPVFPQTRVLVFQQHVHEHVGTGVHLSLGVDLGSPVPYAVLQVLPLILDKLTRVFLDED